MGSSLLLSDSVFVKIPNSESPELSENHSDLKSLSWDQLICHDLDQPNPKEMDTSFVKDRIHGLMIPGYHDLGNQSENGKMKMTKYDALKILNLAATLIQQNIRCYIQRKKYKDFMVWHKAAIKIQAAWRGYKVRNLSFVVMQKKYSYLMSKHDASLSCMDKKYCARLEKLNGEKNALIHIVSLLLTQIEELKCAFRSFNEYSYGEKVAEKTAIGKGSVFCKSSLNNLMSSTTSHPNDIYHVNPCCNSHEARKNDTAISTNTIAEKQSPENKSDEILSSIIIEPTGRIYGNNYDKLQTLPGRNGSQYSSSIDDPIVRSYETHSSLNEPLEITGGSPNNRSSRNNTSIQMNDVIHFPTVKSLPDNNENSNVSLEKCYEQIYNDSFVSRNHLKIKEADLCLSANKLSLPDGLTNVHMLSRDSSKLSASTKLIPGNVSIPVTNPMNTEDDDLSGETNSVCYDESGKELHESPECGRNNSSSETLLAKQFCEDIMNDLVDELLGTKECCLSIPSMITESSSFKNELSDKLGAISKKFRENNSFGCDIAKPSIVDCDQSDLRSPLDINDIHLNYTSDKKNLEQANKDADISTVRQNIPQLNGIILDHDHQLDNDDEIHSTFPEKKHDLQYDLQNEIETNSPATTEDFVPVNSLKDNMQDNDRLDGDQISLYDSLQVNNNFINPVRADSLQFIRDSLQVDNIYELSIEADSVDFRRDSIHDYNI